MKTPKKLFILIIGIIIIIAASATVIAINSTILSWNFSDEMYMYVQTPDREGTRKPETLPVDELIPCDTLAEATYEDVLWFYMDVTAQDITSVLITAKDKNDTIIYERLETYGATLLSRFAAMNFNANQIYGDCVVAFTVTKSDLTIENYEFLVSIKEDTVPLLADKVLYSGINNRGYVIVKGISDLIKFADASLIDSIRIIDEDGVGCNSSETTKAVLEKMIDDDISDEISYDSLKIPFSLSDNSTKYTIIIPKGLLLLSNGTNDEFIAEVDTENSRNSRSDTGRIIPKPASEFYQNGAAKWFVKRYDRYDGLPINYILLTAGPSGIKMGSTVTIAWHKNGENAININLTTKKEIKPNRITEFKMTGIPPMIYSPDAKYSISMLVDGERVALDVDVLNGHNTSLDNWIGFAANSFESGSGDESDPYVIETSEQLAYLAQCVSNGETFQSTYFILSNDIYLEGKLWTPIGNGENTAFMGHFDGDDKSIYNLTIYTDYNQPQGLFGVVNGGSIQNVNIVKANITSQSYIGCLVGNNLGGEIFNCTVQGIVTGVSYVGGLVGSNSHKIEQSIANCIVAGYKSAGSFVGNAQGTSHISNSRTYGFVSGDYNIAGFVGSSTGSNIFRNCFTEANVVGYEEKASGFVGEVTEYALFENCATDSSVISKLPSDKFASKVSSDVNPEFINCTYLATSSLEPEINVSSYAGRENIEMFQRYRFDRYANENP